MHKGLGLLVLCFILYCCPDYNVLFPVITRSGGNVITEFYMG